MHVFSPMLLALGGLLGSNEQRPSHLAVLVLILVLVYSAPWCCPYSIHFENSQPWMILHYESLLPRRQ